LVQHHNHFIKQINLIEDQLQQVFLQVVEVEQELLQKEQEDQVEEDLADKQEERVLLQLLILGAAVEEVEDQEQPEDQELLS
jgi:hypothetical protein